jgi:hypothetical protein
MDERSHAQRRTDAAEPDSGRRRRAPASGPEARMLHLQRSAGNAAVTAHVANLQPGASPATLFRDDTPATATPAQDAPPVKKDEGGAKKPDAPIAPETKKDAPEHPSPPKLQMDLASGEAVLKNAFGSIKQIVPGKIEVLDPAAFKEAYDKIYGAGQWSWDRYVVPTYGSLNGFAYDGVNYINTGSAGLHTVAHEMLHNNTAADWRDVVGSRWDEGTTEVLTQEACAKLKVDAPVCYPGESPVVREAIASGLPLADLQDAYLNGGAKDKVAKWVDENCVENWAAVKGYMEAKDWAAAKAALARKGFFARLKQRFFGGSKS